MSADDSARSVVRAKGVDRVRALQRVLYRCAKQDRDRRFHALFDKVARSDVLLRAWGEVRANRGAAGVDGVTIDSVEASGVGDFLEALAQALRAGCYRPRPLRRVHIPKPGRPGVTRPLGIPTVADRVVMASARVVLEPIFEADFLPPSYGFRPRLSAHHALETVRQTVTWSKTVWALDADIQSCFDEIDQDALLAQIERRVSDPRMLKLLRGWLRAGCSRAGSCPRMRRAPRKGRRSHRCSQSLRLPAVNDVGEPCAGEPHARFDEGAGGHPLPLAVQAHRAGKPPAYPTKRLLVLGSRA
jgi:RNA-directed DNA polymerase